MIFLDASAIIAIIRDEADLLKKLMAAGSRYTSAVAVYEAVLGLARKANAPIIEAQSVIDIFIERYKVIDVPITIALGRKAASIFSQFGKGKHRAALNMGDCFAYVCAIELGLRLLAKGNDFPQTDIVIA